MRGGRKLVAAVVATLGMVATPLSVAASEVIVVGPPFAGPAPVPVPTIERVGGADRYETAVEVSKAMFPPGVPVAYVAGGESPLDALAVAPLAGRQGAPVLLVPRDGVPPEIVAELARLAPRSIVVVGGAAAVPDAVAAALDAASDAAVTRIGGADRHETAALLAAGVQRGVRVVYLASSDAPADALSAGPAAAASAAPLLFVTGTGVPPATAAALARLRPAAVRVVGGDAVVPPPVLDGAAAAAGLPVIQLPFGPVRQGAERVAGADRYDTSAQLVGQPFGTPVPLLFLASGTSLTDGLVAGPAASRAGSSLLLTRPDCLAPIVQSVVVNHAPARVVAVGGEGAISAAVVAGTPCVAAPSGAARVTVSPVENLGDGDVVEVRGAGFPPGVQVAAVECNNDPVFPPDGSGCNLGTIAYGLAGPDGVVGPLRLVVRTGRLNAHPAAVCPPTPEQAARGVTCIIGMGTLDASVVGGAPISFRPVPPPPALDVTPDAGLVDGQSVIVTGRGYRPGDIVRVVQCSGRNEGVAPSFAPTGCEDPRGTLVTVAPDGTLPATELVVRAGPLATNPQASCPPSPAQVAGGVTACSIIVEKDGRAVADHPLTFAPTGGPPRLTVTPSTGLRPGDRVTVVAEGLPRYAPVAVSLCNPAALAGFDYFFGSCATAIALTSDGDGGIGPVDLVVRLDTPGGGVGCPPTPAQVAEGIGACVVTVGVFGGAAAGVPVAFAPDVVAPSPGPVGEFVTIESVDPVREVVVLRNPTSAAIDVGGWWLTDLAGNVVPIAGGTTIPAGGTLSVATGSILDDGFDIVTLVDAFGQQRASRAWSVPPP